MNRPVRLEIVEQPQQRGMRFRYECEGRSAGSIPGENTTAERKTWPACQVIGFSGMAVIRVSLVSKDNPPQPHPHSLVGRDCNNGVCQITIDTTTQMQGVFPNLGIQCVRKKEVSKAIYERLQKGVNPFNVPMDTDERSAADVDLSIVRLCFEAFLPDQRFNYTQKLTPVVSNPIYDKKAPSSALLRICRVDKTHGCVTGNEEVFLLCDKVQKEDIQVVFSHEKWEAIGDFTAPDVHRQVAIVFRTPAYRDKTIQSSVEVEVRLRRPSDGETSAPITFTYRPIHSADSQNKALPAAMASNFGPSDPKRKNIRRAVEEHARKSMNAQGNAVISKNRLTKRPHLHAVKTSAPSLGPPLGNFSQPPSALTYNQPHLRTDHNAMSFSSIPAHRQDLGMNIFSSDVSGPSGLHMPVKPEPHFPYQTDVAWGRQKTPFPTSQPHQVAPPTHNNTTEDFSSSNQFFLSHTPDLGHSQLDAQYDSFTSLGAEGTLQVLEHAAAAPTNIDNSGLQDSNIDELAYFVDRHCSFESDNPPALQPVTLPHDAALTSPQPTTVQRPLPPSSGDFQPVTSPHLAMMSQNQVISSPQQYPPSNITSPLQQYPPTPMSYDPSTPAALSPLQADPNHLPINDFNFQVARQQGYNFTGNANNNNQVAASGGNAQQESRDDSFLEFLNEMQS